MTASDKCICTPTPVCPDRETPAERARRITELRRQVQAGTYLIHRYEIIEGLLDALSHDVAEPAAPKY